MNDSPLDQSVLDELQEATGADFVAELVTTFLEEAPGMIADLKTSAAAGDADGFRRAAHSLKSNASVFGAEALAGLARRIELDGLPDEPGARQKQIAALEAEYARTAAALQALPDG